MIFALENKFQNSSIERLWRAFISETTLIRIVFVVEISLKRSTFDRQIDYLLVQSTCDDSTWHVRDELTDWTDRQCLFVDVLKKIIIIFCRTFSRLQFFFWLRISVRFMCLVIFFVHLLEAVKFRMKTKYDPLCYRAMRFLTTSSS